MDFWSSIGNKLCSEQIKKLLAKPDVTVEEVISDAEFLQEIKIKNEELVSFQSKDEIFMKIIDFITIVPDELDCDYKRCFKYPFIACELFGCDNKDVLKIFYTENYKYLDRLFSVIHSEEQLLSPFNGYFMRIVETLIKETPLEFLTYFFKNDRIVDSILNKHINDFNVIQLQINILKIDKELTKTCLINGTFMNERLNIINKLFKLMKDKIYDQGVHYHVLVIFKNLLGNFNNICNHTEIFDLITSYQNLNLIFDFIDSRKTSADKTQYILYINYIFEYHIQNDKKIHDLKETTMGDTGGFCMNDDDGVMIDQTYNPKSVDIMTLTEVCSDRMKSIKNLLNDSVNNKTFVKLQNNSEVNQTRQEKLTVCLFVKSLCKICNHVVDTKLVENQVLIEIVKFLRDFPFSNILHVQINKILINIFNERSSNILADQLLADGFLINLLYAEVQDLYHQDELCKKKYRKANQGFITEIGSLLLQQTNEDGPNSMKQKIEGAEKWALFKSEYLTRSKVINDKPLANESVAGQKRDQSFFDKLNLQKAIGSSSEKELLDTQDDFRFGVNNDANITENDGQGVVKTDPFANFAFNNSGQVATDPFANFAFNNANQNNNSNVDSTWAQGSSTNNEGSVNANMFNSFGFGNNTTNSVDTNTTLGQQNGEVKNNDPFAGFN